MTPSQALCLTAKEFDAEYLIQIFQGDKVLVTVGTPSGGGEIELFCIWEGDGLDEDGDESQPYAAVRVRGDINHTWACVVREAYVTASMMAIENWCQLLNKVDA